MLMFCNRDGLARCYLGMWVLFIPSQRACSASSFFCFFSLFLVRNDGDGFIAIVFLFLDWIDMEVR